MKKLLLYLIVLLAFSHLSGQQYQLLPQACTFCNYQSQSNGTATFYYNNYNMSPNKDTVVSSNTYILIGGIDDIYQPFGVRQVGDKLYGIVQNSVNEVLLMDFSANVGDTIYNLYSEGALYHAVVQNKDSVLVNNGVYHHFMRLNGVMVNLNGTWTSETWALEWNERGLCNFNGTMNYGGILYNIPFYVLGLSMPYAGPSYCTLDTVYVNPNNGIFCDSCVFSTNSIDEFNRLDFSVFPNPSDDYITIVFDEKMQKTVQLYAVSGKLLDSFSAFSNKTTYQLGGISAGVYFLKVTTENKSGWEKLIKR